MTRLIKKYANRRMYDTQASKLITLPEIANLIRGGEIIRVVDYKNGKDLTTLTLAKVLLEQQKAQPSCRSEAFVLQGIIKQIKNNHQPAVKNLKTMGGKNGTKNLFNKPQKLISKALQKMTFPASREWEENC